jgi:hypothetical protein
MTDQYALQPFRAIGDGLFYSYSVFDSLPLVRSPGAAVHMMYTKPSGANLYPTANHLAVLAVKR